MFARSLRTKDHEKKRPSNDDCTVCWLFVLWNGFQLLRWGLMKLCTCHTVHSLQLKIFVSVFLISKQGLLIGFSRRWELRNSASGRDSLPDFFLRWWEEQKSAQGQKLLSKKEMNRYWSTWHRVRFVTWNQLLWSIEPGFLEVQIWWI